MEKRAAPRATKIILYVLFVAWLLVLTKYILFKRSPGFYREYFKTEFLQRNYHEGLRNANLIPFRTIHVMLAGNWKTEFKVENIVGNITGFIPLGILLLLLYPGLRKTWKIAVTVFLISFTFECVQLFTGLGTFDVDDLLLNLTGGIIGSIIYKLADVLVSG
ncbi:MAG TPA: VanZ family protein [Chitinophagaceae bacterium]|jgi:glycopeptide antibiotics resistance protein